MPGIKAAGWIDILPLSRSEAMLPLEVQGQSQKQSPWVEARRVSPGYFDAAEMPFTRGTGYRSDEGSDVPWNVVVNEALRRQDFGQVDR